MFYSSLIVIGLVLATPGSDLRGDRKPTYEEFFIALHNTSDNLDNISYIYEGATRFPGATEDAKNAGECTFSGTYLANFGPNEALALDSRAVHIGVYLRNLASNFVEEHTYVSNAEGFFHFARTDTRRPRPSDFMRQGSSLRAFSVPHSPDFVFRKRYLFIFKEDDRHAASCFLFRGREACDGYDCLVLDIDASPDQARQGRNFVRYWIDTTRSYNVLKTEKYINQKLADRVYDVELKIIEVAADRRVWYPIKATYSTFLEGVSGFSSSPQITTTFNVLTETILANRPLSKGMFSFAYRPMPGERGRFVNFVRDIGTHVGQVGKRHVDFEGISAQLSAQVDEANRQSNELRANMDSAVLGISVLDAVPISLFFCSFSLVLGAWWVQRRRAGGSGR